MESGLFVIEMMLSKFFSCLLMTKCLKKESKMLKFRSSLTKELTIDLHSKALQSLYYKSLLEIYNMNEVLYCKSICE